MSEYRHRPWSAWVSSPAWRSAFPSGLMLLAALASALTALALLGVASQGDTSGVLATVVVASLASMALVIAAASAATPARVPVRTVVGRRHTQLPPPLTVEAPRFPSRPRAPGRR